jgi:hypothetical protein
MTKVRAEVAEAVEAAVEVEVADQEIRVDQEVPELVFYDAVYDSTTTVDDSNEDKKEQLLYLVYHKDLMLNLHLEDSEDSAKTLY